MRAEGHKAQQKHFHTLNMMFETRWSQFENVQMSDNDNIIELYTYDATFIIQYMTLTNN